MHLRPRRLGLQAALLTSTITVVLGVVVNFALLHAGHMYLPWETLAVVLLFVAAAASGVSAIYYHFTVARRIESVMKTLNALARDEETDLLQLPRLGNDEVGRVAAAVNEVLANVSSLQVRVIERDRELRSTREELSLQEALASKSEELEQRLRERAVLFDVLRAGSSDQDLESILGHLANRLGFVMRLREFVVLLWEKKAKCLVVRAVYGVTEPSKLMGRVVLLNDGPLGECARSNLPLLVDDLQTWSGSEILGGGIQRRGSFAVFPVLHRGSTIGVIAATRSTRNAFTNDEEHLFSAIADQLALTIHHAQVVDELRQGSQHDELTGLANRRLLNVRLEDELQRSKRFDQPTSVLALDIDHFKQLNDRCGHPAGDEVLRQLAGAFIRNLRQIDTVARVGGEEFIVLLPRTSRNEATMVGEKIRKLVEETHFPCGAGQPGGCLTISVGVATLIENETGEALLARADEALYQAKAEGRNRAVLSSYPAELTRSRTSSRS